ncbi:MAG: HAD domain-containing protein [Bacilli bacterium]
MKAVFLDIDGVLVHSKYENKENENIDEEKIKLLKKIIDETDAKIILSSSWRSFYESDGKLYHYECFYKLKELLKKHQLEIYSQTPSLVLEAIKDFDNKTIKFNPETTRAGEINLWLNNNDVESFVILDDEKSEWEYFGYEQNVIETHYNEGLLENNVTKAIQILNNKNKNKVRKINPQ